jgi:hypothetical protein
MSKRNDEPRLPEPYEELLTQWPSVERDDAFWEASAKKVAERLAAARAEAAQHAALLEAPSAKPGLSLAELARRSLEADRQEASASDIAQESLALGRQGRASAPLLAEATRAAQAEPAAGRAPAAAPPAPLPVPVTPRASRWSAGPVWMAGIGLLGLAAAAMIVLRTGRAPQPAPLAAQPPPAEAPAAAADTAKASGRAGSDEIVPIEDLAQGKAGATATAAPRTSAGRVATKTPDTAATSGEAKPSTPEPAKPEPKDDFDEKKKPAAIVAEIPEKPSTGAVQAAIGAVMGGARACVAGQQEASSATVTFGSDGRVQSVSVAGPAAGTPAEACIKAALSKALVQPFARPTFSVGAKVRP